MSKELDNWMGWIQKRIPEAKEKANEFWISQALEGYAQEQIKLLNLTSESGCSCMYCEKKMKSSEAIVLCRECIK